MYEENSKKNFNLKIPDVDFNARETACLEYLAKGIAMDEINKYLHLSSRSTNFYIKSVMLKLKCKNFEELKDKICTMRG